MDSVGLDVIALAHDPVVARLDEAVPAGAPLRMDALARALERLYRERSGKNAPGTTSVAAAIEYRRTSPHFRVPR